MISAAPPGYPTNTVPDWTLRRGSPHSSGIVGQVRWPSSAPSGRPEELVGRPTYRPGSDGVFVSPRLRRRETVGLSLSGSGSSYAVVDTLSETSGPPAYGGRGRADWPVLASFEIHASSATVGTRRGSTTASRLRKRLPVTAFGAVIDSYGRCVNRFKNNVASRRTGPTPDGLAEGLFVLPSVIWRSTS